MESMINLFNRHKEAGTCGFASWCDFVEWLHKEKPDKSKLGELKELSAKAYAATKRKEEPVVTQSTATADEPVKQDEAQITEEEAPNPKKRKPKAGE